jgi:hypothetical protein
MEDKTAINILMRLIEKYSLSSEEKKAVLAAIGILSWSKLGEGRIRSIIKAQKAKRANNFKPRVSFDSEIK